MDWISFCLGLLAGGITGVALVCFVMYLIIRPQMVLAKKSKEKTSLLMQQWAENIAKSSHANKFGGGNS